MSGGSFDESLHPRASDGKFGAGGGGKKAPAKQAKSKSAAQTATTKAKLAAARVAAKEKATAIVSKAKDRAKAIVEKAKARQPTARAGKAPTKEAKAKVAAARAAAKEKARAIVAKAKERARATVEKAKGAAAGKTGAAASKTTSAPGAAAKPDGTAGGKSRQANAVARQVVKAGGSADAADVKAVLKATAELPVQFLQALHANGTKIVACRGSITDHVTAARGQTPRGWPPGSTWDHVPGVYEQPSKEVVIATARGAGGKPAISGDHGSANLVAHEAGHAFDHAMGWESQRVEFQTAYTRDVVRGKMIPYLMQGGAAGSQEAYAESFASYISGKDPGGQFDNQRVFWEGKYGKRK